MTSNAPHQALYRRWRAQTFSQIVGQTAVVETLRNAVRANRVSHAILFVGPRGTGKTSLARILAKALNCTDLQDGDPCDRCEACVSIREGTTLDVLEIDAASNRGIGDVKELRDAINYAPSSLRRKVYILDEAHQITRDAWNALLKSLEEPPEFVAFMFASTHPQDFPPAILSRLQRYDVRRLTGPEIEGKLRRILDAESIEAEPAAVELIARLAAGGMRDAESILDQVLAAADGTIHESRVRELLGLADAEAVRGLLEALVDGDARAGLAVLDELEDRGRDVAVVLDQVIETLREELTAGSTEPARRGALAAVARRLAAIDPERRGVGGTRLQVELSLLEPPGSAMASRRPAAAPAGSATASATAAAEPATAGEPPADRRLRPAREVTSSHPARSTPPASSAERVPQATSPGAADAAAPAAAEPATTAPSPSVAPPAELPGPASEPEASPLAEEPAAAVATPVATLPASDAAESPPGEPGEGIDLLRARWPEIVAHLSQNPPTKPLIAACRPVSVEGNVVTLGFPEDQAFLKDALERRRPILEDGIGRFMGRAVSVRCVATNLEHVPVVPVDPAAADLISEARRIFADDLADVGEVS